MIRYKLYIQREVNVFCDVILFVSA